MSASILAVCDNHRDLTVLKAFLARTGCEVVTANSGLTALRYLEKNPVDVVVIGAVMATVSGLEVVERLRDRGYDRPIIAVTGRNDADLRARGLEAGCDEFLTMPFDATEVMARIGVALRLTRVSGARRS